MINTGNYIKLMMSVVMFKRCLLVTMAGRIHYNHCQKSKSLTQVNYPTSSYWSLKVWGISSKYASDNTILYEQKGISIFCARQKVSQQLSMTQFSMAACHLLLSYQDTQDYNNSLRTLWDRFGSGIVTVCCWQQEQQSHTYKSPHKT